MCSSFSFFIFIVKNEEKARKDKEKSAKAAKDKLAEEDSWRIGSISLDEVSGLKNIPHFFQRIFLIVGIFYSRRYFPLLLL